MGATVGPRELIYAAIQGALKGSMREGVKLAITNRYSDIDREIAEELAQRHLG
jgi:cobaltochelatase CobS